MSELSKKLTRKRELPRHLRELGALLGRPVGEADLLSPEETEQVRARGNQLLREPVTKFAIPFEAKGERRFKTFLERLAAANPSDVYVWTPASNACGVMRPVALSDFDVAFSFDVNPEGIIAILASDLRDRLLLDYSVDDHGQRLLEVETSGERWGEVAY